ncbi:TPA: hypothetical protein ACSP7Z_004731, partial [Serratia fonticola]
MMKLDKLKTLSDELKDETSLDDFHLSIYYYFDGNWNELNNESIVPENIVSSLNGAKKQPGYYAAENDYLLF